MNAIDTLGWAVVHSLWQDALAAAGLASLLTLVPARAARVRYALAALTLAVMLTLPLATALRLDAASDAAMPALAAPALTSLVDRISAGLEPTLPWFVALWLGGVLVMSARLASGWATTRRLATAGTRPVSEAWRQALARLARQLRVSRPVRLLASALIEVPAVIGWWRPVILIPVSVLAGCGLTPLQGGSLLGRVRRLLAPATPDVFPRWFAGVFGGALALAVAIGSGWGLHRSLPASADSLIALATESRDPEVRHDAVKELGQTKNPRARMTLIALAQSDPDDDVRDEAVESPGAAFPDAQTGRVLAAIARRDPNAQVMREAVETLGRMKNSAGLPVVIDIARTHPDPTVRREAVKSIRDEAPRAAAVPVLREIARRDRDPDVRRKAVRALAKVASVSSAAGGSRPAPPASRGA